jgi:hypothetical protein
MESLPLGNSSIHLASRQPPQARFSWQAKLVATGALLCYSVFCTSTALACDVVSRERKDPR